MTSKKHLFAVHVLEAGERGRGAVVGRDFAGVDRGGRALRKAEGEQGAQDQKLGFHDFSEGLVGERIIPIA
jgi:hypothetical protein